MARLPFEVCCNGIALLALWPQLPNGLEEKIV
eukprot:CAMPEP_0172704386 /NCGR_PEP_ID=MMETSP1074-20121228/41233_1 /TAXON_ID=2916 /ORGANISM="Ceratium fusus, Strain PA161109" /LENGTH=31 /DNA_ID= /DNA_START= /DNA_END= /DNA_ORIENTATION=